MKVLPLGEAEVFAAAEQLLETLGVPLPEVVEARRRRKHRTAPISAQQALRRPLLVAAQALPKAVAAQEPAVGEVEDHSWPLLLGTEAWKAQRPEAAWAATSHACLDPSCHTLRTC